MEIQTIIDEEDASLSTVLWENAPIVYLLKEISVVTDVSTCNKTIKCTAFEDNNGAIELAKDLKMRPRTKHVAIKCHHFR